MSFVFFCVLRSGFKNITTSCESLVTPEHASFLADRSLLAIASVLVSFCGLLAPQTCGIGGSRGHLLGIGVYGQIGPKRDGSFGGRERRTRARDCHVDYVVHFVFSAAITQGHDTERCTFEVGVVNNKFGEDGPLNFREEDPNQRRRRTNEKSEEKKVWPNPTTWCHPPHSSLLGDYRRRQPS